MIIRIDNPLPGQIFYIDAQGYMPTLRFEACLLDAGNQPVKTTMQWELQIVENIRPGACASAKIGRQVVRLQGNSVGLGIWAPAFAGHCGGDTQLTVTASYQGENYQASVSFKIRGTNPTPDTVVERMGGELSPLTRLARFVSGLHQFDAQGMPWLGEHGAVGIMQLCNPAAVFQQRWSWVHNVQAGVGLLQRQEGIAKAYLDQHRCDADSAGQSAPPKVPPKAIPNANQYPNSKSLNDDQVMLREMLQRFLGGTYWQWDETSRQWQANPPDNKVEKILQSL
jgi:hypothetical protein